MDLQVEMDWQVEMDLQVDTVSVCNAKFNLLVISVGKEVASVGKAIISDFDMGYILKIFCTLVLLSLLLYTANRFACNKLNSKVLGRQVRLAVAGCVLFSPFLIWGCKWNMGRTNLKQEVARYRESVLGGVVVNPDNIFKSSVINHGSQSLLINLCKYIEKYAPNSSESEESPNSNISPIEHDIDLQLAHHFAYYGIACHVSGFFHTSNVCSSTMCPFFDNLKKSCPRVLAYFARKSRDVAANIQDKVARLTDEQKPYNFDGVVLKDGLVCQDEAYKILKIMGLCQLFYKLQFTDHANPFISLKNRDSASCNALREAFGWKTFIKI